MSIAPPQFDRDEGDVEFGRALGFSDGVFGFAITLLVTTLEMPDLSGPDLSHRLWEQLADLAPRFGTFFLSFAVIGMLWLRHHQLLSRVRRLDTKALVLNLALLAFVVLMPFSTELLGRYGDTAAAVSTYAVNISLEALAFAALWWYCAQRGMLGEPLTPEQMRSELLLRSVIPVVFVLSIALAFAVSPMVATLSWLAAIPGQALFERRLAGRSVTRHADRDR